MTDSTLSLCRPAPGGRVGTFHAHVPFREVRPVPSARWAGRNLSSTYGAVGQGKGRVGGVRMIDPLRLLLKENDLELEGGG